MVAPAVSPDSAPDPSTESTAAPESTARSATPEERAPRWHVLVRLLVAAAAGVLLYLSGPPRVLWWLALIAFAVLGWMIRDRRARAGFGYSLCFGLGYLVPLLAWTGEFVGLVAWLPLAFAEALLVALSGAAISVVSVLRGWPVWAALLWVAGEALRSVFPFGGFPWGNIAFTQPEGVYLPLAAVAGTPLIAFAVTLTGFGLTALVRRLTHGERTARRLLTPVLAVLLPVAAAFGALPLVGTDANDGEATVALVQGNVPRAGLDFNAQRRAVLDNHVDRTVRLAEDVAAGREQQPDLVIWPENSSDIDPFRNPDARAGIDRAATAIGAPIAVGSVLVGDDGLPRNAILLWDPDRGPVSQYTKRQLQPFGETMPWRPFFRLFTSAVDRAGRFVPGDEPTVFDMGGDTGRARVGLATCYEVAFDGVVRESVEGANLLAVPTNNATFGYTEMTYQQLAMDRVRAVEHGREVAVAATSGVSAFVRPDGSISQRTGLFTDAALVERVPLRSTTTLSDRLGSSPEWVLTILGLGALAAAVVVRRRRAST
ncbi:apolipoprotein N-acyltransferase [Actinophytocola sp.]|uniref:apolipoprotein N-acyltransferase n=1 Tax=Actinophytocola sp. TaxID=1872138 RepID=UPI003D6A0260